MAKNPGPKRSAKAPKADPGTTGPADTGVGKAASAKPAKGDKAAKPEKSPKGAHPQNKRVPEDVLIKRPNAEAGSDISAGVSTSGPEVKGDKSLEIIDVLTSRTVKVIVLEGGTALNKGEDGTIVFVESNVIHDVMSYDVAKTKFAVKKDGTVLYGQRGFDDVANADFDMVDIVKLVKSNQKK